MFDESGTLILEWHVTHYSQRCVKHGLITCSPTTMAK